MANGVNGVGANAAAGGGGGVSGGGGNDELSQAFNQAITQAQQTLAISTQGQATLNALRARPN